MGLASSNFTILAYGKYTGMDTTPVKPVALKELQMTGESLSYQTQSITSNNINSSRQISDTVQTGYDVSGGIQIELAPRIYDDFFEAALWSQFYTELSLDDEAVTIDLSGTNATISLTSTGKLSTIPANGTLCPGQFFSMTAGTTDPISAGNRGVFQVRAIDTATETITIENVNSLKPLTVADIGKNARIRASMMRAPQDGSSTYMKRHAFLLEKKQSDLAVPLFTYFSKCYVNTLSVSAQSASLLTGSIDVMGESSAMQDATFASGGGAYTAASPFNGINAVDHVKSAIVNSDDFMSSASNRYIQGFDFQITNNLRGAKAIGHLGNVDILAGQLGITGNINVFFANKDMYDLFISQTEFPLAFRVEDENGNGYVFSFPRVMLSSDAWSASGNDQDLIENMQWSAMYDDTLKTSMQIDRLYTAYS